MEPYYLAHDKSKTVKPKIKIFGKQYY